MSYRYATRYEPGHPLATDKGLVLEHRLLLFAAIGAGRHPCHWCGSPVRWVRRKGTVRASDELVVDHLDGDTWNNAVSNLVPSCFDCNIARGQNRIQPDEVVFVRQSGHRLRGSMATCELCGSEFVFAPGLTEGRFCSRTCANTARRQETCGKGHPMSGDNLYLWKGKRSCLTCRRAAAARANVRKREARRARAG